MLCALNRHVCGTRDVCSSQAWPLQAAAASSACWAMGHTSRPNHWPLPTRPPSIAFRARIVLACAQATNSAVARSLRATNQMSASGESDSSMIGSMVCTTSRGWGASDDFRR